MANYLRKNVKRGGGRDGGGRHQDVPKVIRVAPAVEPSPAAWTGVNWPPMVSDDHRSALSGRHETETGCDGVDHRPAWKLGVAELIAKGWRHHVANETGTHAVAVVFTSPDGSMREERTVLRGMLPRANCPSAVVGRGGRQILRLRGRST